MTSTDTDAYDGKGRRYPATITDLDDGRMTLRLHLDDAGPTEAAG